VTDGDDGVSYPTWREQWKKAGMPWRSKGIAPPAGWNPEEQLASLLERGKTMPKNKASTTPARPRRRR
jgi:hypothetical protein